MRVLLRGYQQNPISNFWESFAIFFAALLSHVFLTLSWLGIKKSHQNLLQIFKPVFCRYPLIALLSFGMNFLFAENENVPNIISVPAGQVIDGDYFALGTNIEISGDVKGDLYALGGQIVVDGNIFGDVLATGASVIVTGNVTGNIRAIGGQVMISGKVGRSVTLFAANGELMSTAAIGENFVAVMGNGDVAASIGQDATLLASNVRLSSNVGRDVFAYVGQLRVTSRAFIGHNLEYTSTSDAMIDSRAKIGGEVLHHLSIVRNFLQGHWMQGILFGSKVVTFLMNFLYSIVVGWVFIRIFPQTLDKALIVLKHQPWKALATGAILLILLPLAFLLLLMTVLGAPFALTILAFNVITFYSAKIVAIFWVSNPVFKKWGFKPNKMGVLCSGLLVYFLLAAIPIFGTVLVIAALLFGLGASALAARPKFTNLRRQ